MNENYKWKGFSFISKGVIVEKTPIAPKPNHSFTEFNIPGRSGSLTIDNKKYDDFLLSMECHFNNNNVNINDIKSWLDGYGKLQLDDEKEYTGKITNSIPFDKIINFRHFLVQFKLHPLAKALTPTTITQTTTGTFSAETYVETYPVITITCTGDVSVGLNGTTFTLDDADGTYILDCEAKIITKNGTNQSSIMSGDFPKVINGSNSLIVSGTISALEIKYYKTYL